MFKFGTKTTNRGKKRHKMSKLGLYVTFSIAFVVLYSIAVLCIFAYNGVEPETLTRCVYGFFAGEVVTAALIKIFNIKNVEKGSKNKVNDESEVESYE